MADEDLTIHAAGADSSDTFPSEAGQLKKGDYVCIKGRPMKIVDISMSKTGKHGHAKAHIVGIDIFTQKKLEENCPSTHTIMCPRVSRDEYPIADVNEGEVHCLDDAGGELQFALPEGELGKSIETRFENGDNLIVTVVSAMGERHITQVKEDTKA
eukprot:TRINITY_DN3218_c1_g1_i1.p2 TRINITY_DN3218_c1_g1~~TRINITY_DN3218_c1_g1_i1.p2  ORF type:complete len:165 (+),score=32.62 TRINITY_DN3218_c1_g1_i1:30-497(+)